MSIGRTARGTFQSKAGTLTYTLTGVVVGETGSCLVVAIDLDSVGSVDGVTWGGVAMTLIDSATQGYVYALPNATAGTADLVVDCTSNSSVYIAFVVTEVTGCKVAPVDKFAHASGTSTTPSSGATAALTQKPELLLGFVMTSGPVEDAAGTWSNSFNVGQRNGTTGGTASLNSTVSEGYLVVASTSAATAAKTAITSRAWEAFIVTFMEAAQVSLPASISAAASVGAAAIIIGAVVSSCQSVEITAVVPDDPARFGMSAPRNPTAVTTQSFVPVRATTPATLGDGDLATWEDFIDNALGLTSGTAVVTATVMEDPTPGGAITGVVFRATGKWLYPGPAILTTGTHRFKVTVGGNVGTITCPVKFNTAGFDASGFNWYLWADTIDSAMSTTQPDGSPWTWAAINAMVDVKVEGDYTKGAGGIADMRVAEIWAEVYMTIGSIPNIIHASGRRGPSLGSGGIAPVRKSGSAGSVKHSGSAGPF